MAFYCFICTNIIDSCSRIEFHHFDAFVLPCLNEQKNSLSYLGITRSSTISKHNSSNSWTHKSGHCIGQYIAPFVTHNCHNHKSQTIKMRQNFNNNYQTLNTLFCRAQLNPITSYCPTNRRKMCHNSLFRGTYHCWFPARQCPRGRLEFLVHMVQDSPALSQQIHFSSRTPSVHLLQ